MGMFNFKFMLVVLACVIALSKASGYADSSEERDRCMRESAAREEARWQNKPARVKSGDSKGLMVHCVKQVGRYPYRHCVIVTIKGYPGEYQIPKRKLQLL